LIGKTGYVMHGKTDSKSMEAQNKALKMFIRIGKSFKLKLSTTYFEVDFKITINQSSWVKNGMVIKY